MFVYFRAKSRKLRSGKQPANNLDQYSNSFSSASFGKQSVSPIPNVNNDQNSLLLNANNSSNSNDTSSIFFNTSSLFPDVHQLYSSALANGQGAINSSLNATTLLNNPVDLVRPLNLPYTSSAINALLNNQLNSQLNNQLNNQLNSQLNSQLANLQASLRSNSSTNFSPLLNSSSLSANSSPVSLNSKTSSDSKSKLNRDYIQSLLSTNGLNSLNNLSNLTSLLSGLNNDLVSSSQDSPNDDDYEDDNQINSIKNEINSPVLKEPDDRLTKEDVSSDANDQPLDFSIKKSNKSQSNSRKRKRASDDYELNAKRTNLSLLNDKDLLKQLALLQQTPAQLTASNSLNSSRNHQLNNDVGKQLDTMATNSLLMKNLLNSDLANASSLFTNGLINNGPNLLGNQLLTNGMLNDTGSLLNANSLLNSLGNNSLLNDGSNAETLLRTWLLENQARQLLGGGGGSDLTSNNSQQLDLQSKQQSK